MFYEFSNSSGVIFTGLILTAWGQHDTDLNNLAYKTRCDSTVADAALRVGVESRRSFARWMVFFMLLFVSSRSHLCSSHAGRFGRGLNGL